MARNKRDEDVLDTPIKNISENIADRFAVRSKNLEDSTNFYKQDSFTLTPEQESKVRWYAVQASSTFELRAEELLQAKLDEVPIMRNYILETFVPVEKVTKVYASKTKVTMKRYFPGYIFIRMLLNLETATFVKRTQYLVNFIGYSRNKLAEPIPDSEIEAIKLKMQNDEDSSQNSFEPGDLVTITAGAFEGIDGEILSINNNVAIVGIEYFHQKTEIELDITDLKYR